MRERARLATARGSKSFYFASRFFPHEMADAAYAVYWFCRTTDDLVDESTSPPDLDAWGITHLTHIMQKAPIARGLLVSVN